MENRLLLLRKKDKDNSISSIDGFRFFDSMAKLENFAWEKQKDSELWSYFTIDFAKLEKLELNKTP